MCPGFFLRQLVRRQNGHQPGQAPAGTDGTVTHEPGLPAINGGPPATLLCAAPQPGDREPDRAATLVAVPGYEIEGVHGQGGMGVVYRARHQALKRIVALKMILTGGHAGLQELARFRIEAEAVARLQHPTSCKSTRSVKPTGIHSAPWSSSRAATSPVR